MFIAKKIVALLKKNKKSVDFISYGDILALKIFIKENFQKFSLIKVFK